MNKKFKRICSLALTIAITATSVVTATAGMNVSAFEYAPIGFKSYLDDLTVIDDKGMMREYDGEVYKMVYKNENNELTKIHSFYATAEFFLREDVNYEEVNDRIIEIFKEVYPDNYLDNHYGISTDRMSESEFAEYKKNFKPILESCTEDGVTRYAITANIGARTPDDEKVVEAKKYSKVLMKKLNDEKLISAFYDFGEVYGATGQHGATNLYYPLDVDIDLIYNYVDEHNIDCTIENAGYCYSLKFNDYKNNMEGFLIAADIYEETSISYVCGIRDYSTIGTVYGKNSLEDLTDATEATTEPTEATTTTTTEVSHAHGFSYGDIKTFSDFTVIDDKGMMKYYDGEDYKIMFSNPGYTLFKVEPSFSKLVFILREDVDYEKANKRVIEIFEEFYPDNYLGVSDYPDEFKPLTQENYPAYLEYLENYSKNYKPDLMSRTSNDGAIIYTLSANNKRVNSLEDEKVAAAKKYSKAFMEKLNEENLISAFYDFGEVYYAGGPYEVNSLYYSLDADIDLIYNYIDENNIDCTIEKDNYYYTLRFNDNTNDLEIFLIALDIYEETSIKPDSWLRTELNCGDIFDKNSLEDLTDDVPATTETTEATEPTTTTTTTTEKATEPTTTITTTTTEKGGARL